MRLHAYSRLSSRQWRMYKNLQNLTQYSSREFHASVRAQSIKPFLLADIGEGIRECEIIQWFVEPEARVEEWDKLCEVQSDKASVEITSRFAGVIKKLHYDAGEMAKVGKPLVDIDIQGEIKQEDMDALIPPSESESSTRPPAAEASKKYEPLTHDSPRSGLSKQDQSTPSGKHATLATPAVRHLTRELDVDIVSIKGTGKDGRVMKDDVYKFARQRDSGPTSTEPTVSRSSAPLPSEGPQQETVTQLSNTQAQMFKTMTRSLTIPHFLYADEIDFTDLVQVRQRLNQSLAQFPIDGVNKISFMPFIIKAVSMALHTYPILNARVDTDSASSKAVLVMRSQHNIGIAMDTPSGLLVPVIKNVSSLNLLTIAQELARLQALALTGKLTTQDLSGGTITVSNIGNIGGTYVSPVIVDREVAILGMGKMRTVPAFDLTGSGEKKIVEKRVCNFSWSADHRVIDGATMARAAEVVRGFVEKPDSMVLHLR
ncbi:2-oxoisovalerate dehydrogenase e2 component (dihydrolipoyl transacylase) [Phlyctema vagabunda]|uniref:Dihydrolipoamide acetyltransferase component of pyruvate dehydrogenase complex n=1 Tax=Phlyctema vagabunda TaxID=108571 RepID=A0ABR4PC74_9HELO